MPRGKLIDLAERCEQATGPDRELDMLIRAAIPGKSKPSAFFADQPRSAFKGKPHFTASLDAAMTLVPEGFDWAVHRHTLAKEASAHVYLVKEATPTRTFAATPALALCAAALRARAQNTPE